VYWRRAERSRVCVLAGPFSVLTALTGVVTRPVSLPLKPSRGLLATVCRMALPLVRLGLSATAVGGVRTRHAADAARFNQPKPKPNPMQTTLTPPTVPQPRLQPRLLELQPQNTAAMIILPISNLVQSQRFELVKLADVLVYSGCYVYISLHSFEVYCRLSDEDAEMELSRD
jgi:hypothetical protein